MKKMIIHYWGDVMCPFCYLGEIALHRALERFPQRNEIEVRWKSSLLHSDMPQGESISFYDHLASYGNDAAKIERKTQVLRDLAGKMGVTYGLDKAKVINSVDIARLFKLATEKGNVLEVAQVFGKAYFSDGVDLSQRSEIVRIAVAAGFRGDEVEALLDSEQYLSEVKSDQVAALHACPRFIPTVYFNHDNMIDGVLNEEQIYEALEKSFRRWKSFTVQLQTMDDQEMGPDECAAICDMPAPID